MASGTWMAASLSLKSSVYPIHLFGHVYPMYAAVPALALNLILTAALTPIFRLLNRTAQLDTTDPAAYVG
jgi:SSS family solute:Na+ symporter